MQPDFPSRRDIVDRILLRLHGETIPLTDLTPISVLRQIVEGAIVDEFVQLYAYLVQLRRDSLITSARGDELRRRLDDFGLTLPQPRPARGKVLVTVSEPSVVQVGAQVRTASSAGRVRTYQVAANPDAVDGSWTIVEAGYVDVQATEVGTGGNAAAGTITEWAQGAPAHLVSVSNPSPIYDGRDTASDSEARQYFIEYLESLKGSTRGGVLAAVRAFADPTTGRRVRSAAIEEWDGVTPIISGGRRVALRVWIDQGLGIGATGAATTDADLVAAVQGMLDGDDIESAPGVRDAGIPTAVESARGLGIDIYVQIDVDSAYSPTAVAEAARNAILVHLGDVGVSGRNIRGEVQGQFSLAKLNRAVLDVPGVLDATFSSPRGDVNVPTGYRVVATEINISTRVVTA